ncbi:MAG: MarR family winged helix-turn-helix transcriptional regulator [Hyphomonadaceae bacterium]|jgi:DNA-binding MarR family transcriptional regulator|uniref:MarR family winged helix-turn-helix transcriptional regulator n=1 Tax=Aquidulcibacter sp. TaxID=2052990 RepID=UPI0022CC844C|nr:MarR family transcriptional regulator [Aquidulcibacter sp.]MCE2890439.1 MarR family transcriptional regulator [Hyphomonadaceae bacterium]MCZ8206952.1 MarR family transcriptional regulator [Aquidulcibacter sp.]
MTSNSPNSDFTAIAFSFFNEIGIIDQLGRNRFERVLPEGLSIAGFSLLNHFVRLNKAQDTPSHLAKAFQVTKGAMTNTIHRLEALGLVTIVADPSDGRGKLISITEAGKAARYDAIARLAPSLQQLSGLIDPKELEALVPTLMKLRAILDANREP